MTQSPCFYNGWTQERTERAKAMWIAGHSASQIARALGGCTRNAVIGKIYRANLTGRQRPSLPGTTPKEPRAPRAKAARLPKSPTPKREPDPVADAPTLQNDEVFALTPAARHWETRRPGECMWPVGTPDAPALQFSCCARVVPGRNYCAEHAKAGRMKNGYGVYSPRPDALIRLARKVA